jgi:serine/threonine-protein kinase
VCPIDASQLADADDGADPLVGTIVGDCYEVMQVLGYGGMATVYAARHTRLPDKRFAIKLLLPEFSVKPEVVLRFGREAETASKIQHPNVVDVYDVHRLDDGTPYIVCEYLAGRELGLLLDEIGKLDARTSVKIARQVCSGLAAAHAAGVVHRDMKPENVFLVGGAENPLAKVIDFGISKVTETDESSKLTRTGFVMGTPSYMPPEQARGGKIDHRTDVYGVGAILYRCLTGRVPFEGDDPAAVLAAVVTKEPTRPRSLDPGISETLELIIERAMAKNPDDRYQTVEAMEADLSEWELLEQMGDAPAPGAASDTSSSAPTAYDASDPNALARASRHARRARPQVLLLSVLGFCWLVGGVFDAVVGIAGAAGRVLTGSEAWLVFAGICAVALTPTVFWIRHLVRRVWPHSVRALRLAHVMARLVGVGVAGYGVASVAGRTVGGLGGNDGSMVVLLLPLTTSLLAAGVAWLLIWRDQLAGERRGTGGPRPAE